MQPRRRLTMRKTHVKAGAPNIKDCVDIVHSLVTDRTHSCLLPAMFKEGTCVATGHTHLVMTVLRNQAEVLCQMQNWCSLLLSPVVVSTRIHEEKHQWSGMRRCPRRGSVRCDSALAVKLAARSGSLTPTCCSLAAVLDEGSHD